MNDQYFRSMYSSGPDPWRFETSAYEHRKYDLTTASLRRRRYRTAYEPGCSNGALTERLAARCDRLIATDIVDEVVDRARQRFADSPHVDVRLARFPVEWPTEPLDLIVWSEVAYYLGSDLLERATERAAKSLDPDGDLVVVNYTGPTNYPLTAPEVDGAIEESGYFERCTALVDTSFRLDVWGLRSK